MSNYIHGNQENQTLMVDSTTRDDVVGMVQEALGIPHMGVENDEPTASDPAQAGASDPSHVEEVDPVRIGANDETLKYFKLMEGAQIDLYPGCHKFTSLSFIVQILHMKVLNQWTDKSVDRVWLGVRASERCQMHLVGNKLQKKMISFTIGMVLLLRGVDGNQYCSWCHYLS